MIGPVIAPALLMIPPKTEKSNRQINKLKNEKRQRDVLFDTFQKANANVKLFLKKCKNTTLFNQFLHDFEGFGSIFDVCASFLIVFA